MNRLAIFDIDGTLTDTNGVDDEAYCAAVAAALGIGADAVDWSGATHVTDSQIFRHLCALHGLSEPSTELMSRARSEFVATLAATLADEPHRFTEIRGASDMLRRLGSDGWCIAVATGGWGSSARLKLRAAALEIDEALLACADDGISRADIVQLAHRRAEEFYERRFDRVVSVGDGLWDLETAAALRLPFIGIAQGEKATRLRGAGADVVFADYLGIDGFLDALQSVGPPTQLVQ